jgi:Na+-transporting NADH:ubiquinone oxidoreductase subunit A
MVIRIRNGLDIPMAGAPEPVIDAGADVTSVAITGSDHVGLEARLEVAEGDRVVAGAPLFRHKRDPAVPYTAPGSGVVSAVHRGSRRVLESVVITLDGSDGGTDVPWSGPTDDVRAALIESGLWTAFRTRPFSRVPHAASSPGAIFVTAMDTRPLAADPSLVVAPHRDAFATGLERLAGLAPVWLCTAPGWTGPTGDGNRVRHAVFDGPHPAGLPGTHIHHLHPVGAGRTVWHVGAQDVVAMGKLLGEGRLWLERVVAIGGTGFERPRLLRTRLGADLRDLLRDELRTMDGIRLISGSVLCGREVRGNALWLGRYHVQVTALPLPRPGRRPWWRRRLEGGYSFAGAFARHVPRASPVAFEADQNGRATALVPIDAFERLMPVDVLTQPLLRSLLVGDTDQAQALGCLELDEEDLALCSFVCPGKNDYGAVLRENLNRIEQEG